MILTTEGGTELHDPEPGQLELAIAQLGLPGNGFAILAKSEHAYVQTTGSRADGFVVEFRDGSEATQVLSARTDLPLSEVTKVFLAYLRGGSWKQSLTWQAGYSATRSPRSARAGSRKAPTVILIVFFLIGSIACLFGAYSIASTRAFLAHSIEVPGQVVQMMDRGGTWSPIVEFADKAGVSRLLRSTQSTSPPLFFVGQEVSVVYDPSDPGFPLNAKINTFLELWGPTMFAFIFGGAFGGIALLVWIVIGRQRRVRGSA
jgi:hypothetical protein